MNSKNLKVFILSTFIFVLINSKVKATDECFEGVSRSVFKFNMVLDDIILEPIAKGYNKLPGPIKSGTSNFTSNISTLLSIPKFTVTRKFERVWKLSW